MPMASFPAIGPAFAISMGYVDLGKWLAAVDGGAQFGNDLMLLVLLFNLIAILCQYLATCVSIVTEKNLAEICRDEYSGTTCMILGGQAELSLIISNLTMILGVAHGFNLLLGVDLFACVCLAAAGSTILSLLMHLLVQNDWRVGLVCETISGMALVFYVLGVLISQPEIPLAKNIMFPKLSGESAYSLMALLGANIMVHNFYVHSSIVQQQQKRPLNVPVGALLHDHFFAIMFIFTGISLVNYVLMNSAASVFGSTDMDLNFRDVSLLMDQIFRIPIAPIAVLLLLFCSQIGALAWNSDGPQLLHNSFGANVSVWNHFLLVKAFSVIPALFCAKIVGAEGIYQFLILCQVIQAMLLPSSVIPLFRVASSRSIMREYKMAWYLDIMSLLAFLLILASNIIFINEMLFGNSSWINNLMENTRFGGTVTYAVILLAACALILFTLYLAVTPLKSASDFPEEGSMVLLKDELHEETEDDIPDKATTTKDEFQAIEHQFSLEPIVENTVYHTDRSLSESILEQSDTAIDSDNDWRQTVDSAGASDTTFDSDHDCHPPFHGSGSSDTFVTPIYQPELSKSIDVADLETVSGTSTSILLDSTVKERHQFETEKEDLALEAAIASVMEEDKTSETNDSVGELLVPVRDPVPHSRSEDSECGNTVPVKISDVSGNLPKLSGLGRTTRRQFAAILDEFWGQLFDFHGKPSQEAVGQKYDSLLGLDSKSVSSVKGDIGTESSVSLHKDPDRGANFPPNPMEYNSRKLKNLTSGDLSYGFQMGSSTWSPNMQAKTHFLNSTGSLPETNERRYSSLYLPQYSGNHDYQPATIHGYQLASYLKEIGAARNPCSSNVAPESPRVTKSSLKVPPGFGDSVPYSDRKNGLSSLATSSLQSPTTSRVSRIQAEGNFFNPSLVEPIENADSFAYEKKYHSSPDISALIAASRNYYLNESKLGGPIGFRPSVGRMMTNQHQYLNPISRTAVSSPFNELYSPSLQRDALPPQSNLSSDTKSLWAMQPFEQLFAVPTREYNIGRRVVPDKLGRTSQDVFPYAEVERRLLQSLRSCIMKLLKLESSDWLFRPNDGCDEELIYQVATTEKNMCKVVEMNQSDYGELHLSPERKLSPVQRNEEADIPCSLSLPNCRDGCIWRASLVVSFGVWCIHRILDLSLVESRPELWGKYTYVLNRLQGILDLAFSKRRAPLRSCSCLDVPVEVAEPSDSPMWSKLINQSFTTAAMILDIIKEVEISVSGRKGRTGTAAGDIAFPKGKENLASVLKRYKRRLLNKSAGAQEVSLPPNRIQTTPAR
ncbi:protein ETHYLENE-INSENSITIVE 2-like isoform X2 [Curcuma longa]|uniref:protein ETHYLENE-INSENSITIVE 2-like isoform X2 n=1 Tax=Curcuma longa TaxID=136217 RepID=UPI003D9F2DD6